MIIIDTFEIASDATKMNLSVTTDVGQTISSIEVRDVFSYETQNGIDLSSKLSGSSNVETVEITAEDISESVIEGIYYVIVTDTLDQSKTGVVLNSVPYLNHFISLAVQYSVSCDCKDIHDLDWTKYYGFVDTMKYALINGFQYEANQISKYLSKTLCLCEIIDYLDFPLGKGAGLKTLNDIIVEL